MPETSDHRPIWGLGHARNDRVGARRAGLFIGLSTLTAVIALALAGCGSSYSKHDLIQRAEGICLSTTRAVRSLAPPEFTGAAEQQRQSLAAYLAKVSPLEQRQARRLSALPKPPGGRRSQQLIERWLTAVHESADELGHLAAAAQNGNASGVADASAQLAAVPVAQLASEVGAHACAGPGATYVHSP